jgi:hypothetical protein
MLKNTGSQNGTPFLYPVLYQLSVYRQICRNSSGKKLHYDMCVTGKTVGNIQGDAPILLNLTLPDSIFVDIYFTEFYPGRREIVNNAGNDPFKP